MASSTRVSNHDRSRQIGWLCFLADVHKKEDGKLTLVATIMMLAMVVLIGLIGNAGHTVNQKIEAQNAADAAAFSSALWMARGMNALTATNHMLGEVTSLCAIHEAIGGPGADLGIEENTTENQVLDGIISVTLNLAPIGELPPNPAAVYVPAPVHKIDRRIIKFITDRTTPSDSDERKFKAFATILDSKMTLKRELNILLLVKSIADLGFYAPPPISWGTVPAAYVAHIASTLRIVLIGKEWIVLEVIEDVAGFEPFKKLKLDLLEAELIPTLIEHANFVASYDPESKEFESGILNVAIERTLRELEERHSVDMATFPAAAELRLPVVAEPAPSLSGGADVDGWGDDNPVMPDMSKLDDLKNSTNKTLNKIRNRIRDLEKEKDDLDGYEKVIDERLKEDDISDEEKAELESEKQAIADSRKDLDRQIAENKESEQKIVEENAKLPNEVTAPFSHPSVGRIPSNLMDQSQERYTQWVRATHPYTDSFRAPILAMFKKHLKISKAAKHFEKWSNRYTMVKAWQFRSGYRIEKTGDTSTQWRKSEDPLQMLVMKDAFDGQQSRKGSEPWTNSSDAGKAKAEEYFTLIGFAHRTFEPLFSTVVYPSASDKGITAYAQAIFYNGNQQQTPVGGDYQTKIGWDTLNWDPQSQVPEWGGPASESGVEWPWQVFTSKERELKVKLNWQPKLMPVTESRLEDSGTDLSGDMADNVEHAIEYFEELGTH